MSKVVKEFDFSFNEYETSDPGASGKVRVGNDGLAIYIDGYGECTSPSGEGSVIILEKHDGKLRLLIWDDIQEEDPLIINLESAHESRRLSD